MASDNDVIKVLYNQIIDIAEEVNKKNDRTISTAIVGKNENKYTVRINGVEYNVLNGTGFGLSIGQQVWVTIPQNNYSKIFISGIKTERSYPLSPNPSTPSSPTINGVTVSDYKGYIPLEL